MSDHLNIINHSPVPKFQSYLTQENERGFLETVPKQQSFRRKSLVSRFVEEEHSAKNHKEFSAAQS